MATLLSVLPGHASFDTMFQYLRMTLYSKNVWYAMIRRRGQWQGWVVYYGAGKPEIMPV
jgi:hypothetical protein